MKKHSLVSECEHRKAGACPIDRFLPVPHVVHSVRIPTFARLTSNMSKPVKLNQGNSKLITLLIEADS